MDGIFLVVVAQPKHALQVSQAYLLADIVTDIEQAHIVSDFSRRQVHLDEIEHVRFGWRWLERFKKTDVSAWDAYRRNVTWPLRPALARGTTFHPESRVAAGLDGETIQGLTAASRDAKREDASC